MRIGILQTGEVPEALRMRFGPSYPAMMAHMLGEGFVCTTYDVTRGEWPAASHSEDAYLVTGSSAGAYDDLPWIAPLEDFLRRTRGTAKIVGICFGHQIMAQAFGGTVGRSEKGWGLGLQTYVLDEPEPPVSIAVSHRDQVLSVPPGAHVLGGNAFTPYGVLGYGAEALSFQCHPEFEPAYAAALVELRRPHLPDPAQADALIATLDGPNDRERVVGMIRAFFTGGEQVKP